MKYNKEDFEIIYFKEYVGRIIFIIKYKDKYTFVYKRSGFNSSNYTNEIIPFMFLNTRKSIRGPIVGYIFKEYLYNTIYTSHIKRFSDKENRFLNTIKELVLDYKVTQSIEEIDNFIETEEFNNLVYEINAKLKEYFNIKTFLDYYKDI